MRTKTALQLQVFGLFENYFTKVFTNLHLHQNDYGQHIRPGSVNLMVAKLMWMDLGAHFLPIKIPA